MSKKTDNKLAKAGDKHKSTNEDTRKDVKTENQERITHGKKDLIGKNNLAMKSGYKFNYFLFLMTGGFICFLAYQFLQYPGKQENSARQIITAQLPPQKTESSESIAGEEDKDAVHPESRNNAANAVKDLDSDSGTNTDADIAINRLPLTVEDSKKQQELDIDGYRLYLAAAMQLIINFYQEKEYSKQLLILKQQQFPDMLNKLIMNLTEYNELIKEKKVTQEPVNTPKIFSKFIKINKISISGKEQQELKNHILPQIDIFADYIYSSYVQEQFIR